MKLEGLYFCNMYICLNTQKNHEREFFMIFSFKKYLSYKGAKLTVKEEKEKVPEKIVGEIIEGNFPNLGKEIVTQVWDMQ